MFFLGFVLVGSLYNIMLVIGVIFERFLCSTAWKVMPCAANV